MLQLIFTISGIVMALVISVAVLIVALSVRTAVNANPQGLSELTAEFGRKPRINMRWHKPSRDARRSTDEPDPPRLRLVRGGGSA